MIYLSHLHCIAKTILNHQCCSLVYCGLIFINHHTYDIPLGHGDILKIIFRTGQIEAVLHDEIFLATRNGGSKIGKYTFSSLEKLHHAYNLAFTSRINLLTTYDFYAYLYCQLLCTNITVIAFAMQLLLSENHIFIFESLFKLN